jgi:hypothetical protein
VVTVVAVLAVPMPPLFAMGPVVMMLVAVPVMVMGMVVAVVMPMHGPATRAASVAVASMLVMMGVVLVVSILPPIVLSDRSFQRLQPLDDFTKNVPVHGRLLTLRPTIALADAPRVMTNSGRDARIDRLSHPGKTVEACRLCCRDDHLRFPACGRPPAPRIVHSPAEGSVRLEIAPCVRAKKR